MIQLAMQLPERKAMQPRYPNTSQDQLWDLLNALRRGEKLTMIESIDRYGISALSQRCGDLRRLGWPIKSKLIPNANGGKHSQYWIEQ